MTLIDLSTNQIIYAVSFVATILIAIYFLLIWQIKEVVKDELEKTKYNNNQHLRKQKVRERRKKLAQLKQQKMLQQTGQSHLSNDTLDYQSSAGSNFTNELDMDIDSYVDPAEGFGNYQRQNLSGYSGARLDKSDMMARDIADGVR